MALIRINCLDASAIVTLFDDSDEHRGRVRAYRRERTSFNTTTFCVYEALRVFKRKYRKREISKKAYIHACRRLFAEVNTAIHIEEPKEVFSREVFGAVEEIVKRHNLDVSDALQIHTLKTMEILNLPGECQAILVTGDEDLANAASVEGLRPWN